MFRDTLSGNEDLYVDVGWELRLNRLSGKSHSGYRSFRHVVLYDYYGSRGRVLRAWVQHADVELITVSEAVVSWHARLDPTSHVAQAGVSITTLYKKVMSSGSIMP
jgi:hypothetical protein